MQQCWSGDCELFTVAVALIWLCVAVAISLCVLIVGLLVYRRYVNNNLLMNLPLPFKYYVEHFFKFTVTYYS